MFWKKFKLMFNALALTATQHLLSGEGGSLKG